MADTTITGTAVKSVTSRNIHAGTYALVESVTQTTTPSASQVFLIMPLHSKVTVLDGWVTATFAGSSYSMDLQVGTITDHSLFMSQTEVTSGQLLRFNQGLPHTVTLTDSDTFPLMKPLTVTVAVAASGTIVTTPVYTVMALFQNL